MLLLCIKPRQITKTSRISYFSDEEEDYEEGEVVGGGDDDHDHNNDEIDIEGKKVTQMEVCKVLYDGTPSSKKVMVFSCKLTDPNDSGDGCKTSTVCLKLMDNNDIYQNEKQAYENMLKPSGHHDVAAGLFLKVYFFCEVIMPDNRAWKGYCMQEAKYSVREILTPPSSDPVSSALAQRKILQDILQDKEKALREDGTSSCGGGVPVVFQQNQSIQLSIAIAALQLMHQMHIKYGWAHGDTHMGNFMYMNRRVYAIDFERSFASDDPVQHLLDLQEFFGHFSGILLNPLRVHEWDMRDIFGLYYFRHPLLSRGSGGSTSSNFSRRETMYMLPICTCFTCPTMELRKKGCQFCKSSLNRQSAQYVEENFDAVIKDLSDWGLNKMKNGLNYTRSHSIMKQCCNIADLIYPCIQDGSVLRMRINDPGLLRILNDHHAEEEEEEGEVFEKVNGRSATPGDLTTVMIRHGRKRKYVEIDRDQQNTLLNSKLINDITKSKQQCVIVLKRLLYMPVVSKKANNMVREIVCRLRTSGFVNAANMMWTNTASPYDDE